MWSHKEPTAGLCQWTRLIVFRFYFYSKKKKLVLSLKQRQQRTIQTLIWGSSTIVGWIQGTLHSVIWGGLINFGPPWSCYTSWPAHTWTQTYSCTHKLFFLPNGHMCLLCVCVSGLHDPFLKNKWDRDWRSEKQVKNKKRNLERFKNILSGTNKRHNTSLS